MQIGFLRNTVEFWENLFNKAVLNSKIRITILEKREFNHVKEFITYQLRNGLCANAGSKEFEELLKRLKEIDLSSVCAVRRKQNKKKVVLR